MFNFKTLFLSVFIALVFSSCGGDEKLNVDTPKTDTAQTPKIEISEEEINALLESIPSPVEMASMIKATGADYNVAMLNTTENVSKYNTAYRQAFNIGTFSADLGYINIYEKTFSAMDYLSSIKELADGIKVGQFFDFSTLKRMATSNKNYDSLLYISTENFNKMDAELRKQKRGELSVLIIAGAWLEGLHIANQVGKVKLNKELQEKIGEQKINLDNLMVILEAYKSDKYFGDIVADFNKLKTIYDEVKISYEYKGSESKEVNGQLVVVNNSTTIINITPEQIIKINDAVEQIRGKMIN